MQLPHTFAGLALVILVLAHIGMTTPLAAPPGSSSDEFDETATISTPNEPASYIVSPEQMAYWIRNTNAELTFIGKPINPLAPRSAQDTTVVYCTNRVGNDCGSPCTVYNGGSTCLNAPNTNCLFATHDIGFCDAPGCSGDCTLLTGCILTLDDGFCWTPNTESILVSTA